MNWKGLLVILAVVVVYDAVASRFSVIGDLIRGTTKGVAAAH